MPTGHPGTKAPHGTETRRRYHGCRCYDCVKATKEARAQRRRARGIKPKRSARHGTDSGYHGGCRCADCLEGHAAAVLNHTNRNRERVRATKRTGQARRYPRRKSRQDALIAMHGGKCEDCGITNAEHKASSGGRRLCFFRINPDDDEKGVGYLGHCASWERLVRAAEGRLLLCNSCMSRRRNEMLRLLAASL